MCKMDTEKSKIIKGMIIKARYANTTYRLERVVPVRKGKNVENELHFYPTEPGGLSFKMMEQDYINNSVLIIKCYPQ